MQALTLTAGQGWRWLPAGYRMFRRNPPLLTLLVLTYWLCLALISIFPLVGGVISYLALPALSVLLMNGCRLVEREERPMLPLLLTGIQRQPQALVLLGGIYLVALVCIMGLSALVDQGALFNFIFAGKSVPEDALENGQFALSAGLALLLVTPVVMAYWFAPLLVAWHGCKPVKALFFSFVACKRNWRPFLAYALNVALWSGIFPAALLALCAALFADAAGFVSALLTVPLVLILAPTLMASFYVSYREIFLEDDVIQA